MKILSIFIFLYTLSASAQRTFNIKSYQWMEYDRIIEEWGEMTEWQTVGLLIPYSEVSIYSNDLKIKDYNKKKRGWDITYIKEITELGGGRIEATSYEGDLIRNGKNAGVGIIILENGESFSDFWNKSRRQEKLSLSIKMVYDSGYMILENYRLELD